MLSTIQFIALPPLPLLIAVVSYPVLAAFGTWRWALSMKENLPSEVVAARALAWPRLIAGIGIVICLLGIAGSLEGIREFIIDRKLTDYGVAMGEMMYLSFLWTRARCGALVGGSGYIWLCILEYMTRRRMLRRGNFPGKGCE